jgi:23S rRNA (cytosine1962-C5)-methyltransferase
LQRIKKDLVEIIKEIFSPSAIIEKSDTRYSAQEEFHAESALLFGESVQTIKISENERSFFIRLYDGQKTGFYLDLREARNTVRQLSYNREVLNCYAYTGGLSVAAAKGEAARVTSVESSEPAIKMAGLNWELNRLQGKSEFVQLDVLNYLEKYPKKFDLIILDPPAFARHRKDVERAAKRYQDVNRLAFQRLQKGGLLMTLCCSQHVSSERFQKAILEAACQSGRQAKILSRIGHPLDHPVSIYHTEGEYLKGLLLLII